MASLTLSSIPGFTDLPPANFNAGATASDADMKALLDLAKFAAVRNEQFWGFYKHGETVALPESPADGYQYTREELVYSWSWYWTGSAAGACNGTHAAPSRGSTSGGGTLLQKGALVNASTGEVSCNVSYFDGTQHDTNDGILLVITHAQRSR